MDDVDDGCVQSQSKKKGRSAAAQQDPQVPQACPDGVSTRYVCIPAKILHGTQQDQRGPIENELNEYGHKGRVLAPVIAATGVLLQTSASYWTLLPGS